MQDKNSSGHFLFQMILPALLLLHGCISVVQCSEFFSSMYEMEKLQEHEHLVSEKIAQHIQDIDLQIETLNTFLQKHYQVSKMGQNRSERVRACQNWLRTVQNLFRTFQNFSELFRTVQNFSELFRTF